MRASNLIIILAMICGIAVLCVLGGWQVYRLNWKEALIAQTNERISQKPVSLSALEKSWGQSKDVDYFPVSIIGSYKSNSDVYYFNTLKGTTGWNVITPFELADGRVVLVNRGFVPDQLRKTNPSIFAVPQQQQTITALARNPIHDKPNSMMPDNQLEKREFYWKSYPQLVKIAVADNAVPVLPFLLDAGLSEEPNAYPKGGTTRISFPNNHLQYALTWFGLAFALLAVGTFFLYDKRKREKSIAT